MASIMVVDDEPFLRRILSYMLIGAGHQVECLENGQESFDRLQKGPMPDLLITDLMMPGLSGIELVTKIRGEIDATLPIVVLTARGQKLDQQECERCGANAFMTKPFRSNELLDRVNALLAESSESSDASRMDLGTGTDG